MFKYRLVLVTPISCIVSLAKCIFKLLVLNTNIVFPVSFPLSFSSLFKFVFLPFPLSSFVVQVNIQVVSVQGQKIQCPMITHPLESWQRPGRHCLPIMPVCSQAWTGLAWITLSRWMWTISHLCPMEKEPPEDPLCNNYSLDDMIYV